MAALATLRFNGLATPAPDTEEAASFVESVARGEAEVQDIAKRLREWMPA